MSESGDGLRKRLTELEQRIDAFSRQLSERGELTSVHEAYVSGLKQRRDQLAQKVEAAVQSGDKRRMLEAEFERDFEGIHASFAQWLEQLDAGAMKESYKG